MGIVLIFLVGILLGYCIRQSKSETKTINIWEDNQPMSKTLEQRVAELEEEVSQSKRIRKIESIFGITLDSEETTIYGRLRELTRKFDLLLRHFKLEHVKEETDNIGTVHRLRSTQQLKKNKSRK